MYHNVKIMALADKFQDPVLALGGELSDAQGGGLADTLTPLAVRSQGAFGSPAGNYFCRVLKEADLERRVSHLADVHHCGRKIACLEFK